MPGFQNEIKPGIESYHRLTILQHRLLSFSLFNFFIVSVSGLLLRGVPIGLRVPFNYSNILHGHSHFAFGGWITPGLLWLMMKSFPGLANRVAYVHWRNVFIILMLSAYGMLISFPLQGYAAISISFSTLSIAATFYFSIMLLRATRAARQISINFLRAALFFLMLSSLGPFALGAITASGKAATPIYFNSIYFYLHFQYNGWFTFAILAVVYKNFISGSAGRTTFTLLFSGCILSVFLSFLWNQPGLIFNITGGVGAVIQLTGLCYLLYDLSKKSAIVLTWLEKISLSALALKIILQVCGAFPQVANYAYLNRNLIIAYLHLVMLGFATTFIISSVFGALTSPIPRSLQVATYLFLAAFVSSELLLVFHGSPLLVFIVSCAFPVAVLVIYRNYLLVSEGIARRFGTR